MTDARTDAIPFDARTVARLARAHTTSFDEAVLLIQQYADTVAALACVKATEDAADAMIAAFNTAANAPLVQR
jgi:hypothetical protein